MITLQGRKKIGYKNQKKRNTLESLQSKNKWASYEEVTKVLADASDILLKPEIIENIKAAGGSMQDKNLPNQYLRDFRVYALLMAHHTCAASRGGELSSLLFEPTMAKLMESEEPMITLSEFKTAATYEYKSFVLNSNTREVFLFYGNYIRPLVLELADTPSCPYFFVTQEGKQWINSGSDLSYFTKKYSDGKFELNNTRLRQV